MSIAHVEHQQLADVLAVTLRLGPATPEFEAQVRALRQAVGQYARSEEPSLDMV